MRSKFFSFLALAATLSLAVGCQPSVKTTMDQWHNGDALEVKEVDSSLGIVKPNMRGIHTRTYAANTGEVVRETESGAASPSIIGQLSPYAQTAGFYFGVTEAASRLRPSRTIGNNVEKQFNAGDGGDADAAVGPNGAAAGSGGRGGDLIIQNPPAPGGS